MTTFQQAIDHEMDILRYAIMMEEEYAIFHEGCSKSRIPFISCPVNIGNDPCDDQSWDDDEGYDW